MLDFSFSFVAKSVDITQHSETRKPKQKKQT
uniref:Uncharacterized protein n=1 Tax=Rhizophora mucronata TaxID=61149 RepID=A0A2P2QF53_RHIMU